MNIVKTQILTEEQASTINRLWNEEYPLKLKDRFPLLLEGVVHYNHYLIANMLSLILHAHNLIKTFICLLKTAQYSPKWL